MSGGVGVYERREALLNGPERVSIVAPIAMETIGVNRMIVLPRSVALVAFALTLAQILSWPAALQAQDYPTRPVRIIVPFGAMVVMASNAICTWPPITLLRISPEALCGTCTRLVPLIALNSSAAMW